MNDKDRPSFALRLPWRAGLPLWIGVLLGCGEPAATMSMPGGVPERGRQAIERYGCAACHTIPGIAGHGANIGPPLAKMATRGYVAGVLPHTPDNLVRWLRDPPAIDPRTAMPNLGVTAGEAADIAAYLYRQN